MIWRAFYNLAQIFIYGQWNSSLKGKILIVSKVILFSTTLYTFSFEAQSSLVLSFKTCFQVV